MFLIAEFCFNEGHCCEMSVHVLNNKIINNSKQIRCPNKISARELCTCVHGFFFLNAKQKSWSSHKENVLLKLRDHKLVIKF